jgi:peptidoglycan hydrolase-like protein with peptidoglycan-binding domain
MTSKLVLRFGSTGAAVVELQHRLNATRGPSDVPLVADGIFGQKTLAAVKRFQLQGHPVLIADGIAGPLTRGKLLLATLDDTVAVASQIRAASTYAPFPLVHLIGSAMAGLDVRRGRT